MVADGISFTDLWTDLCGLLGMRAELWRTVRCLRSYWWKHERREELGFWQIAMEDIEAQRLGDKPTSYGIIRLPGPTPLPR